jgi:hypothetical protein
MNVWLRALEATALLLVCWVAVLAIVALVKVIVGG